ncbi:MAG: crossover junction endodeoxyribonuclease RuvC [Gammaproteobacteria bacterium]|nr:crossover junction endodeoxyribonuclease RuvC [Gammaproteobacteria bacterium]
MRVLGIDPGSRITGYGIVEFEHDRVRHLASGCIHVRGDDLAARLRAIFEGVASLVDSESPTEIAVEQVFIHRNAASALKLGQARGAALMAGVSRGLPLYEYTPTQVKQAVTGRGHAAKEQIQHMVRVLLSLRESPVTDAADALAVAICHGHMRDGAARLERASRAALEIGP